MQHADHMGMYYCIMLALETANCITVTKTVNTAFNCLFNTANKIVTHLMNATSVQDVEELGISKNTVLVYLKT